MSIKYHSHIQLPDSNEIKLGTSSDLRLYHDGSNSYINDSGTGSLILSSSQTTFQTSGANRVFVKDSGVELVTPLTVGADDTGHDVIFYGATSGRYLHWDESQDRLELTDNVQIAWGSGIDFTIKHDGTNTHLTNSTGSLIITQHADDDDIILKSDDGSGGTTAYLTLDGSAGYTTVQKDIRFNDDVELLFGTDSDFKIKHNGSNGFIRNFLGDLYVLNAANDKDIIFQSDDGSGGTTTYFRLDGSSASDGTLYTQFPDNSNLTFGSADDLQIKHDGTDSKITNTTGDLVIRNLADDKDIIFQSDDGSGGIETYFFLDGSASGGNPVTIFPDSSTLRFGSGGDLQLYHDGANSYIAQTGTGDLYIRNTTDDKDIIFQNDDGSGGIETYFYLDGSANGANQLTVFPDGSNLAFGSAPDTYLMHNGTDFLLDNYNSGNIHIRNTVDDKDIIFSCDDGSGGTTTYFYVDGSSTQVKYDVNLKLHDNKKLIAGDADDLQIYHDGTNTRIENNVGDLQIQNFANDKDIKFMSDDGSGGTATYFMLDGSAGYTTVQKNMQFGDGVYANFGASSDIEITHVNDQSFILNNTNDLTIRNNADDKDIIFQSDDGSGGYASYFRLDGSEVETRFHKATLHLDSVKAKYGDSGDLQIYHDGSNSVIDNNTGILTIQQSANNSDIIFKCDDGAGNVGEYFRLDGSAATHDGSATTGLFTNFPDKSTITLGTGGDLHMKHNGTDTTFDNYTGHLKFTNYADDSDIVLQTDNGSGGVQDYIRLDGSVTNIKVYKDIVFADNIDAHFGTGGDLRIYHDGTDSRFQEFTGNLNIINYADDKDIVFQSDDGSGGITEYFRLDGSEGYNIASKHIMLEDNVELRVGGGADLKLYHDGSNNYIQASGTGDIIIEQRNDDKDIVFNCDDGSGGIATYFRLDGSASSGAGFTVFPDSSTLAIGNGYDMRFQHNGTNSYILNYTGNIEIEQNADDKDIILKADDGSGGTTTYVRLDGSQKDVDFFVPVNFGASGGSAGHDVTFFGATNGRDMFWDTSQNALRFDDNAILYVGSGNDAAFWHNGTDTFIENFTGGNLYIDQEVDDGDIVFRCDDQSGGVTEYFRVDGGEGRLVYSVNSRYLDNAIAMFGTGADLQILSDGNDGFINNVTNHLYITSSANDCDVVLRSDDGSGGVTAYLTLDGSQGFTTAQKALRFDDSVPLQLGSSADLRISHDGSTSAFIDNHIGDLYIKNNEADHDIYFQNDDGSGGLTNYFYLDGGVADGTNIVTRFPDQSILVFGSGGGFQDGMQIYHNGTNSFVNNYVGNFEIRQETNDADLILKCDDGSGGQTAYITLDGSASVTKFDKITQHADNVAAKFGYGNDLVIFHDGTNNHITADNGDLTFTVNEDDHDIIFKSDDGSGGTQTYLTIDGSADRTVFNRSSRHGDGVVAAFGSSEDLQIYHDGSHSRIVDTGTGNLVLNATDFVVNNSGDTKNMIIATDGGSVSLYYNANKKFETTAYGAKTSYAATSNTDGDAAGDIVNLGETTTVAGKIYYYKSDGEWGLVDASAESTAKGLLAVALGTSSNTHGMLLRGMATIANDPGSVGDTLFVSETAGQATATAPTTSSAIVRVIGYCLNASNGQVWFNPDGAFVEVA